MLCIRGCALVLFLTVGAVALADGKYAIKAGKNDPPKEVKEPLRKTLGNDTIQLLDAKGAVLGEVWFRKEVPGKATPEQIKNGLTYREIEEGTLFGVMRLDQMMTDYRKQKMAPGVYTLRLGFQPMDGDHMGTAPFAEFFLVLPAAADEKIEPLEIKQLREESSKAVKTSHPGILLLFPNPKPEAEPKLVTKEGNHVVLNYKADIAVGGKKAPLGVGFTVIGHSTLE